MARATYLADTSVFARLSRPPVVAATAPLVAEGQIAVCAPVIFELGFSARNAADHQAMMSRLAAFESVPVTDGDHRRAVDLQGALAEQVHHRALSLVDALVASIAETRDLIVLHYDSDFELLADVAQLTHHWVVPRGTAD